MCVAGGHQVDDGDDLLLEAERVRLTQPQRAAELLGLRRLLLGPADVAALQVDVLVEVVLRRDITWVVRH